MGIGCFLPVKIYNCFHSINHLASHSYGNHSGIHHSNKQLSFSLPIITENYQIHVSIITYTSWENHFLTYVKSGLYSHLNHFNKNIYLLLHVFTQRMSNWAHYILSVKRSFLEYLISLTNMNLCLLTDAERRDHFEQHGLGS